MVAPTPRSATITIAATNVTQIVANIPSNVADGELLIMVVGQDGAGVLTAPGDWTAIVGGAHSTNTSYAYMWSKVWNTSDPMTVTVTTTLAERMTAGIVPFSGQGDIDVSASAEESTSPYPCPTVTTTVADTYVLRAAIEDTGTPLPTHSHGSLTTLGQNGASSAAWLSFWGTAQASAGASGVQSITSDQDRQARTFTVAIKPETAGQTDSGGTTATVNVTGQAQGFDTQVAVPTGLQLSQVSEDVLVEWQSSESEFIVVRERLL